MHSSQPSPIAHPHGGSETRASSSLMLRTALYAFGIELPYGVLVPLAYLRFVAIGGVDERLVVAMVAALHMIKTALLLLILGRKLRPIEQWRRLGAEALVPSQRIDALTVRAARAAYSTPVSFTLIWASTWAVLYFGLTLWLLGGLGRVGPDPPGGVHVHASYILPAALFALACFFAAMSLGYSVLVWLLAPVAGAISLVALERGLQVPGRSFSLGARLVLLAVCLAGAPTSWFSAMALAQRDGAMERGSVASLVLFAVVAVAWAPVCAAFLSGAIASPFRRVAAVMDQIIRRGDVERLERVPIYFKDEIGALTASVNAMVERLQETSARMRAYLAERERLLAAAAHHAAELETVLDHLVEGVFVCDASGRIVLINASGLRLLGLEGDGDERRPMTSAELQRTWNVRRPQGTPFSPEELPLARALGGQTVLHEDQLLTDPSTGRDRLLRTSAAPMRADGGAVLGAVAVARDVTDAMQLEIAKDQFLRVAAHELKTPVTIVKGWALALLRGADEIPERYRRMFEALNRGADRITRVVDELLAVSQSSLDLPKVAAERFDLRQVAAEAIASAEPSLNRHRLRLLADDAPLWACGDAGRVRQILGILLDNAVRYSPAGGDVDVTLATVPPREVEVSVRDRGVGIPVEKQARIMQLFYRAHTDTPHDYGGLGVGLYLARDLIMRQGGQIWFESEEGRGSTFYFRLPLAPSC